MGPVDGGIGHLRIAKPKARLRRWRDDRRIGRLRRFPSFVLPAGVVTDRQVCAVFALLVVVVVFVIVVVARRREKGAVAGHFERLKRV